MTAIRLILTYFRKRKAIADLEADVERRLKFQGLSREDRRAVSRLEKAMRVS